MPSAQTFRYLVDREIVQREETGHDVRAVRAQFERLGGIAGLASGAEYRALLDALDALPGPTDWPWVEPSDLPGIVRQLGEARPLTVRGDVAELVRAAWTGRVVGNMLGKPVEDGEHWNRRKITDYLRSVGALPLRTYVPVSDEDAIALHFQVNWPYTTLGRVDGSDRDDDVDYTVLALELVERYGRDFTTEQVASLWLELLPFHQTFTAERATYRNLVWGDEPAVAAERWNPYREWIGAMIRADLFGYINPADPRQAALDAYKDAALSHRANGIYGEMWAAALIAAAFSLPTARDVVVESLRHVPARSRLHHEVTTVLAQFDARWTWERALTDLETRYARMHWVHTLNNAGVLTAALLWGEGSFDETIALSVIGGLDTDSVGGTAGSVAGILAGPGGIADGWTDPLRDRLKSAVFGYDGVTISGLAARTIALLDRPPATGDTTGAP